jgi:hypothetical protein
VAFVVAALLAMNAVATFYSIFKSAALSVVPANAGIHNHRLELLKTMVAPACSNNIRLWLWLAAGACHRAAQSADPVAGTTWRELSSVTAARVLAARCVRVFQAIHPPRMKRAQGMPGVD